MSVASYVQYDTESDLLGTNTRLRWTLRPQADLFVVYNHNVRSLEDRWQKIQPAPGQAETRFATDEARV